MISIKEFLEKYTHLQLQIQHLGIFGGVFMVRVCNATMCDCVVFEHCITDFDIAHLHVDFETAIMTPIYSWLKEEGLIK